jgi:hypothetical protein
VGDLNGDGIVERADFELLSAAGAGPGESP